MPHLETKLVSGTTDVTRRSRYDHFVDSTQAPYTRSIDAFRKGIGMLQTSGAIAALSQIAQEHPTWTLTIPQGGNPENRWDPAWKLSPSGSVALTLDIPLAQGTESLDASKKQTTVHALPLSGSIVVIGADRMVLPPEAFVDSPDAVSNAVAEAVAHPGDIISDEKARDEALLAGRKILIDLADTPYTIIAAHSLANLVNKGRGKGSRFEVTYDTEYDPFYTNELAPFGTVRVELRHVLQPKYLAGTWDDNGLGPVVDSFEAYNAVVLHGEPLSGAFGAQGAEEVHIVYAGDLTRETAKVAIDKAANAPLQIKSDAEKIRGL